MEKDRGKEERGTELNELQRLKRREKRDWIDGTDNLVYIFNEFLLCSASVIGEEANTYSTLGAFQATPLKPTHELLHFALLPSKHTKHLLLLSVKNLVILTTPSQARPTMIACMQAFSNNNEICY